MIKAYFALCEADFPEQRSELRQIALALRRQRLETMEQLIYLYRNDPRTLANIRGIGQKRLQLIREVCRSYETDHCRCQEE